MGFSYGAGPEKLCNVNECNDDGPAIKPSALNQSTDPLEVCAVASSLNRELISCLIFHSNQYAREKLNVANRIFVEYKGTNIHMSGMRKFLGNIEYVTDIFRHRKF